MHKMLHLLILYLQHHPHTAELTLFVIMIIETLPVIGTLFPGSALITAIAALAGAQVIPMVPTFLWAIAGCILGDCTGYFIGYRYKAKIQKMWPFNKRAQWLQEAEKFFKRHGGKSIVIGRIMLMRSTIPMIAGSCKMPPSKYLMAGIPSILIVAVTYLLPGLLLGSIVSELPPHLALEYLSILLAFLLLLVLVVWGVKIFFAFIATRIDFRSQKVWRHMCTKPSTKWLVKLIGKQYAIEDHTQFILLIYLLVFMVLLCLFVFASYDQYVFLWIDRPMHYLLLNIRNNVIDHIAIVFAMVATKWVTALIGLLFLCLFIIQRHKRLVYHWLALIILSIIAIVGLNILHMTACVTHILASKCALLLPIGYICALTSMLGFLTGLVIMDKPIVVRKLAYSIYAAFLLLIGFSRILLGVHLFANLLTEYTLGVIIALIVVMSYRRHHTSRIKPKGVIWSAIIIICIAWGGYGGYGFRESRHAYALSWPHYTISYQAWQLRQSHYIPVYRLNRLGDPVEVFNVEFLGSPKDLRNKLHTKGWEDYDPKTRVDDLLQRLATHPSKNRLPIFPRLYHGKPPTLLMLKKTHVIAKTYKTVIVLRLWQSDITIKHQNRPFWLGSITYHRSLNSLLNWLYHQDPRHTYYGATEKLEQALPYYRKKTVIYPQQERTKIVRDLQWNGKILLITQD